MMSGDLRIAVAGDAMIAHRITQHDHDGDPHFARLRALISGTDVASVNFETSAFDLECFDGWPAAERGGSYLLGKPFVIDELVEMGFSLFARANNHAGDWGIEGLLATSNELDARGAVHAGVGVHLASAAEPAYIDTHSGRVAMVSFTTTFPTSSMAGAQRPDIVGRPGCNGVKVERQLQVPAATHEELLGMLENHGDTTLLDRSNLGLIAGEEAAIVESLDRSDVDRVLTQIEKAAALADFVFVNGHTHEPANHVETPPAWLPEIARSCIDAGANAYLGHGPHRLRGIELYAGRPIFYSLGNFIAHRDSQDPIPSEQYRMFGLDGQLSQAHEYLHGRDGSKNRLSMTESAYHESVVAILRFDGGHLVGMDFHPIELGVGGPPGTRGTPRLADGHRGHDILERLVLLSKPLGFGFEIQSGVGRWTDERKVKT